MTGHRGYAYGLLSAIVALILALSAAIYAGVSADDGTAVAYGRNGVSDDGRGPQGPAAPASTGVWAGTWAASPVGGEPGTAADGMAGRSVRNVVHTSVGGTSARITLSNLYGTSPLTITHATLALAAGDGGAVAAPGSLRRVTFGGGSTTVVVPAGGEAVSDAVRLAVPYDSDVLVTTYSPTASGPVTYHPHARETSYTAEGEHTEDVTGEPYSGAGESWRYLTALDVLGTEAHGTVVALGDSLTDGSTSGVGADRRWPDVLADRLRGAAGAGADVPRYGVVNEGISGNQVLADRVGSNPSGLNRFERDVLGRPDVRVVVIDLGINDILRNPRLADPEAILAGLRTLTDRAHTRNIKVIGATLMPFRGHRGYSDAREDVRQRINEGIREGRVYDAYVDFDKKLRDPYDPRQLRPDHDSGDHLHPNDEGYEEMGETLDLTELRGAAPTGL